MNSFIIARVDYCNRILAGVPKYQLDRLQSILNVATRLIFGYSQYDHITPLLRDRLHWLRVMWVTKRIDFKQCLMVFKELHGLTPGYISDYCVIVSTNQRQSSLRSASHNCLVVPHPSKTIKFEEHLFGICGPTMWNSLPDSVKDMDSIDVFIYLFMIACIYRPHVLTSRSSRLVCETKTLPIRFIVWLVRILQLFCKYALIQNKYKLFMPAGYGTIQIIIITTIIIIYIYI